MRPKLLVIVGTLAHMGGAERQALYLVEYLASLGGCEVEVLAFEDGEALRPHLAALGVRVHYFAYYFRWPRARRARALAGLAALLRFKIKPDALLPFVGIHSKTAAMVWPYSGARFCWWNQQDEGRDLTGTPVESRILRRVSSVISNSEEGKNFLLSTYDLAPDSVLVYNNGTPVPPSSFASSSAAKFVMKGRPLVTMVANVTAYKDHNTLFRAWSLVKKHFASAESPILRLAGHLREQDTVAELKMLAFEVGLSSEDIQFLGPVSDVGNLFIESDLVVHSSTTEGCPNAVCEAMAMGKAVVATNISGCRQALGSDRWLAEPGNTIELASLIVRVLEDQKLRDEVGTGNRERIKSAFTIESMNRFFLDRIEPHLGPISR